MGKKTDTKHILQVGKKNNKYIWDSKYIEKHKNEFQIYLFRSLEIKNFITNFLKMYGLNLYSYNITFSEARLKIFISYFKTSEIRTVISKINVNHKLRLIKKKLKKKLHYKNIEKKVFETNSILKNKAFNLFYNFYNIYFYLKKFFILEKNLKKTYYKLKKLNYKFKKFLDLKKIFIKLNFFLLKKHIYSSKNLNKIIKKKLRAVCDKIFIKHLILKYIILIKLQKLLVLKYQNYLNLILTQYNNYKNLLNKFLLNKTIYKKRLKSLRDYKNFLKIKNNKIYKNLKVNNFLQQLTKSLNVFTKSKYNHTIVLQQVNQNIIFSLTYRQLQSLKKLLVQLRQFKNASFFNEGLNVILSTLIDSNNVNLLGNFISNQLKVNKRHGYFFKFLTKILSLSLKQKFSKPKSIKILIKGRINGKPRSNHKLIFINKHMPLMTINSFINFTQTTAFSLNGTFGIKIWLNKN